MGVFCVGSFFVWLFFFLGGRFFLVFGWGGGFVGVLWWFVFCVCGFGFFFFFCVVFVPGGWCGVVFLFFVVCFFGGVWLALVVVLSFFCFPFSSGLDFFLIQHGYLLGKDLGSGTFDRFPLLF